MYPPLSPQLTKLHQLAMQQSPFPIAPNNQGFQGRSTEEEKRPEAFLLIFVAFSATFCLCRHWLVFSLFSWDGCFCTNWFPWADHSKWCKCPRPLWNSLPYLFSILQPKIDVNLSGISLVLVVAYLSYLGF
jgi:hypothetical protein